MNWGDIAAQFLAVLVLVAGICLFALIWTGDGS